mmetsp:Transcript_12300/g.52945  ORF Transcript_12300/g.52945 Transcript_12300/m.52945 type:complete len:202 (+) Transcript_12300:1013-1618(+)
MVQIRTLVPVELLLPDRGRGRHGEAHPQAQTDDVFTLAGLATLALSLIPHTADAIGLPFIVEHELFERLEARQGHQQVEHVAVQLSLPLLQHVEKLGCVEPLHGLVEVSHHRSLQRLGVLVEDGRVLELVLLGVLEDVALGAAELGLPSGEPVAHEKVFERADDRVELLRLRVHRPLGGGDLELALVHGVIVLAVRHLLGC